MIKSPTLAECQTGNERLMLAWSTPKIPPKPKAYLFIVFNDIQILGGHHHFLRPYNVPYHRC